MAFDAILAVADRRCRLSSGDERRHKHRAVITKGGPAHSDRAMMFVFHERSVHPCCVAKIAFDATEAGFLRIEFDHLSRVDSNLGTMPGFAIPKQLAIGEEPATWILMTTVPGHRLAIPGLLSTGSRRGRNKFARFLTRTVEFSSNLYRKMPIGLPKGAESFEETAREFLSIFHPPGSVRKQLLDEVGRAHESNLVWEPGWQHGDLSVGNVLSGRGDAMAILDWENSQPELPQWYDRVHTLGLSAALAQRQASFRITLLDAALVLLREQHWTGPLLREVVGLSAAPTPTERLRFLLPVMKASVTRHRDHRTLAEEWAMLVEIAFIGGHMQKKV